MNVTYKRLLSWLVVVTMVLSMVPVFDLSNFAVTTKAAENPAKDTLTAIEALRDDFATAAATNATVSAICPVCGGEEAVEWTALNSSSTTTGLNGHYYLTSEITTQIGGTSGKVVCLNLNGNNVTVASAAAIAPNNGTTNIMDTAAIDGTVSGGDTTYAATIFINGAKAAGEVNIYGGTFTKASGTTTVPIIQIGGNGGTINMYGGTIDAQNITNGNAATAVYLVGRTTGANAGKATFNLYGGTIYGGSASGSGGTIRIGDGNSALAEFNVDGGTISGGKTEGTSGNSGGSIYVNGSSAVLNVYSGTIENGEYARTYNGLGGGNIALNSGGKLHMEGGTISGGKSYGRGGNIYVRDTAYGTVEILGGKIINGEANVNGDNISVETTGTTASTLTIGGTAQISGGIYTGTNVTTTLSGDAKIVTSLKIDENTTATAQNGGIHVTGNSNINISELTAEAEIWVTGGKGAVFTADSEGSTANAANVVDCFHSTDATLDVFVNNEYRLYFNDKQPEVGTFDPWNCQGKAYCEACMHQNITQEPVSWTALKDGSATSGLTTGHYYLADNMTQAVTRASGATVCLNLNGKSLTVASKAFGTMDTAGTMNIMDTPEGKGTVTGYQASWTGAVLDLREAGAYVNIYGGTFKKSVGTDTSNNASIFFTYTKGGNINMYGGTIDGSCTLKNSNYAAGVYLYGSNSTFKMYGGQIINCVSSANGAAVIVGSAANSTAVFEMYGGTVSGGNSGSSGGNFYINGGTLKVYDGAKIANGVSTGTYNTTVADPYYLGGGNVSLANGGTLDMQGGVICGGTARGIGGNIHIRNNTYGTINISGGKIYGGEFSQAATQVGSENIGIYSNYSTASTLHISGGEISGEIVANGNISVTLSGAPTIKKTGLKDEDTPMEGDSGLNVTADSNIIVSDLANNAEIWVTGSVGTAFTPVNENATAVAGRFFSTIEDTKVIAEYNKLKIVTGNAPLPGEFKPWDHENKAYCPVCNGDPVEWNDLNAAEFVGGRTLDGHYYLSDDLTYSEALITAAGNAAAAYITPSGTLCFNLNGNDLTVETGRVFFNNNQAGTLNVIDTADVDGTVYGGAGSYGSVFGLGGAKGGAIVNVYGGTFKHKDSTTYDPIVYINANGGTFNMYGGTIDATDAVLTEGKTLNAVFMQGGKNPEGTENDYAGEATFNMYGGVIKGNNNTTSLVRVGTNLAYHATNGQCWLNVATFNMYGGLIYGGNVVVANDNELKIDNGTIVGRILAEGHLAPETVPEGQDYSNQTVITLLKDAKVTNTGMDGDTPVSATEYGLHIGNDDVTVDISGLTENAELYISGNTDTPLMDAHKDENVMDGIQAYREDQFLKVNDQAQIYLVNAQAVVRVGEDGLYYETADEAVDECPEGGFVEVHASVVYVDLEEGQEAYIDNRGNTVHVSGAGTLYAMDWANDDYYGYGTWYVDDTVDLQTDVINPVNGNRYIVIDNEDGTFDAHRIQMYLTGISLRPSAAGLYYKAAYKCDEKLASLVTEYGIVYNAEKAVLDFNAEGNVASIITGFAGKMENHAVSGTSTLVYGIFKTEDERPAESEERTTAVINAEYGEIKIQATPYIKIGEQVVLANVADTTHNAAYLKNNGRVHEAMSMLDVLKTMDAAWDNTEGLVLTEAQKTSLQTFYKTWKELGMSAWEALLPNISDYTAPEAEA